VLLSGECVCVVVCVASVLYWECAVCHSVVNACVCC